MLRQEVSLPPLPPQGLALLCGGGGGGWQGEVGGELPTLQSCQGGAACRAGLCCSGHTALRKKPSISQHLSWMERRGRDCLRRPDHRPAQAPSFLFFTRQCLSWSQATAQHGGSEARSSLLPLSIEPGGLEDPGLLLGFWCLFGKQAGEKPPRSSEPFPSHPWWQLKEAPLPRTLQGPTVS